MKKYISRIDRLDSIRGIAESIRGIERYLRYLGDLIDDLSGGTVGVSGVGADRVEVVGGDSGLKVGQIVSFSGNSYVVAADRTSSTLGPQAVILKVNGSSYQIGFGGLMWVMASGSVASGVLLQLSDTKGVAEPLGSGLNDGEYSYFVGQVRGSQQDGLWPVDVMLNLPAGWQW